MRHDEVRLGLQVQIIHKTKYGSDRWQAPARILSVIHADTGAPNIRIMLLDGTAEIFHSVDPEDLDYE